MRNNNTVAATAMGDTDLEINSEKRNKLETQLEALESWIIAKKKKVICIFESEYELASNPFFAGVKRGFKEQTYRIISESNTDMDQGGWYFQPLVQALPNAGQIIFFKNYWYGRALKKGHFSEKSFSNGQTKIWQNFPQFEKMLLNSGYTILKFWLPNPAEQADAASVEQHFLNSLLKLTDFSGANWQVFQPKQGVDFQTASIQLFLAQFKYRDLTFPDKSIPLKLLKKRAYNLRWAMVEEGVIPLTTAHIDYPVAKEIQEVIQVSGADGIFPVGPVEGLSSFKQAAVKFLKQQKKLQYPTNQILPIDGEAAGMFSIAQSLLKVGDEAIVFNPMDFIFEKSITASGAKVKRVSIDIKTGEIDLLALRNSINEKTKLIVFSNPLDPLGKLFTSEEMSTIIELAEKHDLWILNNESWSDYIFDKKEKTDFAEISTTVQARLITVYGFEKSFGLAGMRVGFVASPNKFIHEKIKENSFLHIGVHGVAMLSQLAATTALNDCTYWLTAFNEHLKKMRTYCLKRINKIPNCHAITPKGTYTLLINIEAYGLNSFEMAKYLLKEAKVAVIPGAKQWFGSQSEGYIRISFGTSKGVLKIAFDRIEAALNSLDTQS